MVVEDYEKKALSTATYDAGHAVIYPVLGLNGEAGEVAEKVKKVLRDNQGEFSLEKRKEILLEVSDCLWYCTAICRDIGFSLEECMQANIDKLASRKERGVIHGNGDNR